MFDETSQISLLLSERIESLDAERDTLIVRFKEEKPRKYPLRSLREIILLHAPVRDVHHAPVRHLVNAHIVALLR